MKGVKKSAFGRLLAASVILGMAGTTEILAQDMSTYYTVSHPDEFEIDWASFYTEMTSRTAKVRSEFPHKLDQAFGDDPKQRLDLYLPKGELSAAPVFLFLHGGGFREGDRAHYGAIAEPFLVEGIITAVASYRLTGDGFHYPDQSNDTKNAIKWLYNNVAKFGGDPESIFVGGHSAGAILSADIGVDLAWMESAGIPSHSLKGIIPVSGPYDLRGGRAGERDTYAPTPELMNQASPILHVGNPAPEAIVAVGSKENYQESSMELVEKLNSAGAQATYILMDGEDHKDTARSLANPESQLFKAVVRMING